VEDIQQIIIRNRNRGVIVDANLLLVYIVEDVNPNRLSKFTRTSQFDAQSHELLVELIGNFNPIVTTPNILTEVCNLLGNLKEPERSQCLSLVKYLTESKAIFQEFYIESKIAANEICFTSLELTDSVISHLAKKDKYLLLTIDLKLHLHLLSEGIDSINFNNLLI
jgi:rRNA-processing protein FCF1